MCLSNFNPHTSSRSGNDLAGSIQIIRIEINHFQFGDLFELLPAHFADTIPLGITCTFGDFSRLLSKTAAGGVLVINEKDRS